MQALIPVTKTVHVPFDMHSSLIGKRGAEIRQFQEAFDVNLKVTCPKRELNYVHCQIPHADARADEVYVSGTRENVDAAIEELTKRVKKHALESFTVRHRDMNVCR